MQRRILAMTVAASVWAASAEASCEVIHETVVRGRFLRCEKAQFYWDASGGDRAVLDSVEREIASSDAGTRDRRRARILAQLPDPLGPPAELVVVLFREWQALTTPWQPPDVSTSVQLVGSPRELRETVRYLWRGPPEACEATPQWSYLDLWITSPCCDTPILTGGACLMHMNFAEPAPAPLREALASALDGR